VAGLVHHLEDGCTFGSCGSKKPRSQWMSGEDSEIETSAAGILFDDVGNGSTGKPRGLWSDQDGGKPRATKDVHQFDCDDRDNWLDRGWVKGILARWQLTTIGLKVFFVPCAGRLASPIFHRWMTLSSIQVDSIAEGFMVFESTHGMIFYCSSWNVPVEP
jgi:hypothetical protein